MLLKFWLGTRFVTPKSKNMSPKGYSHAEHKFLFPSAHLLIHSNLLKKSKSIPTTFLKFWVGTRFVTTPTPTTNNAAEDHNILSGQSPSG